MLTRRFIIIPKMDGSPKVLGKYYRSNIPSPVAATLNRGDYALASFLAVMSSTQLSQQELAEVMSSPEEPSTGEVEVTTWKGRKAAGGQAKGFFFFTFNMFFFSL